MPRFVTLEDVDGVDLAINADFVLAVQASHSVDRDGSVKFDGGKYSVVMSGMPSYITHYTVLFPGPLGELIKHLNPDS